MITAEDDYKRPLKEMYEGYPEPLRISLDEDAIKIWKYFIIWGLFVMISIMCVVGWISSDFIDESVGDRIQRSGSILPLFGVFGEIVFLVNLNKLCSVIHPAQLSYQIYKERRFKILKKISLYLTLFLIFLGGILSGYGDVIYKSVAL